MSYLAIFFDLMSYSTESHIDQKSYATKSRTDETTFDEMLCTRLENIHEDKMYIVLGFLHSPVLQS